MSSQDAAAHTAGARLIVKARSQLCDEDLRDLGGGLVVVQASPDAMNDTQDPLHAYTATELDGSPLRSRGDEPLRCERCGRLFTHAAKPFSAKAAHEAKPCVPPAVPEDPHPVRLAFPRTHLPLVERLLAARGLEVREEDALEDHSCSVVVDLSLLQRTLRELAFAEASAYNLEQWYEALQGHTASTVTVPLEDADWEIIKKLHAAWHIGYGHSVDQGSLEAHAALEQRLQLAAWPAGSDRGLFVKTSMRSPKDAAKLEDVPGELPHERLGRQVQALCVRSGAGAVELLCGSRRVVEDIGHFTRYRVSDADRLNVVLRQWDEEVAGAVEWRCFVFKGRLTCISQYHCYTTIPAVVAACEADPQGAPLLATRDRIATFQQQVHLALASCLKIDSYVLDVATPVGGGPEEAVRLIEVNPTHSSGAALFSWSRDTDLLVSGRPDGHVELRVAGASQPRAVP